MLKASNRIRDYTQKEALFISRAKQGDHQAFEALVRRYQRPIYSLALRMLGNPEDAEDVLQETFLSLYRSIGKFRGDSRLGTYLHRLAANFSLMRLRKRKSRHDKHNLDPEKILEMPDPQAFSLERYLRDETKAMLNKFLLELPDSERTAVVLSDIEGFGDAEASRLLGLTLPAFKSRLRRGRESLRKILLPYMGYQEKL